MTEQPVWDPNRMCPHRDALDLNIPNPKDGSLIPEKLMRDYARDVAHHLRELPVRPKTMSFLEGLFAERGVLPTGPSLVVWGGGHVSGAEFEHAKAFAGYLASRVPDQQKFTVVTGSGSGVMQAAHEGAREVINSRAVCLGVTMQDLLYGNELPGSHNDHIITVRHMPRRIVALAAPGHVIGVKPGGIGTTEELFAALSILNEPSNRDMRPLPVVLSDSAGGDSTWLKGMVDVVTAGVGPDAFKAAFIVQAGEDFSPLDDLNLNTSDPNGFWRRDLVIPQEAFRPVQLSPENVSMLDLSNAQDDPGRFFAHMRRFSQFVTDVLISDLCSSKGTSYLDKNGPLKVRISGAVFVPFSRLLLGMWKEGRIRTERPMSEVIQWDIR